MRSRRTRPFRAHPEGEAPGAGMADLLFQKRRHTGCEHEDGSAQGERSECSPMDAFEDDYVHGSSITKQGSECPEYTEPSEITPVARPAEVLCQVRGGSFTMRYCSICVAGESPNQRRQRSPRRQHATTAGSVQHFPHWLIRLWPVRHCAWPRKVTPLKKRIYRMVRLRQDENAEKRGEAGGSRRVFGPVNAATT